MRKRENDWNSHFPLNLHPSPRLCFPKGIMVFLLRGGPENWKSQLFGETTWELLKNCIISVKQQKIIEIVGMSTFPCFCRALVAPWRKHQYSYRIIDGSGSVPGPPNRPRAPEMQIFTKMTCILCFSWHFMKIHSKSGKKHHFTISDRNWYPKHMIIHRNNKLPGIGPQKDRILAKFH